MPNRAIGPVPVTVGMPLPTGVFSVGQLTVIGASEPIPIQVREVIQLGARPKFPQLASGCWVRNRRFGDASGHWGGGSPFKT